MKLKELRQAYQKTREVNGHSGSKPQTCRFYNELHGILGGSATTTPAVLFDSFNEDGSNTDAGFGDEEDDDDEVVDSSQKASGETGFPDSQELFLTLDLEPVPPEPTQAASWTRQVEKGPPISRCMIERGHDRDTLQCRVKVKKLRNAYHKAWEANHCSNAVPMSCRFYKELDAILGGDPTSTAKAPVDTLLACVPVESGLSREEEILDEEGERDPEAEDDSAARDACSEELFSIPEEPSQSQQADLGKAQTGEEAPAGRRIQSILTQLPAAGDEMVAW
ncbi:hypothetical protein UY3_08893 [Chelonia mydas]|uniref:Zinc finger and SCAN domain-containing protein 29 n=1 Tax=Chelonia mydas TaxID=8469 RepID=M7B9X2_CHEMY|nr:hypothetical protein UY3_08893 [Chelonia mydas]